ncbi:hypothetical protein C9439_00470 [archaeon SCG-AAA382B04]|nr:hypothetical protein C9439_00470 [archaeon SCG-AAA382B04]
MSKEKEREGGFSMNTSDIDRRKFLKGLAVAGSAAAVGVSGCLDDNGEDGEPTTQFACPYCDKTFSTESDLKTHIDENHMGEETEPQAGRMLVIDYTKCTGCGICEQVCAEKWQEEIAPDTAEDTLNFEYSRMKSTRFQFVDTLNVCRYCTLQEWAEGSTNYPCAEVCPPDCIETVPEGEGKEGYTGMGYKKVNRDQCLGLEDCGKCLEICEEQFGSDIFFDPEEHLAQICTMCGGQPACADACPEDAIEFAQPGINGRYFARTPDQQASLLYRKLYNHRREI